MKKLLWIGDAACDSGFARATHKTLDVLRERFEVSVLGLNYRGDPHDWPYPIYPCWPGGDMFGVRRIKELFTKIRPDVVVIQNDPWNIPAYMKAIDDTSVMVPRPVVIGAIAVDGKNCRGWALNDLDHSIFWTEFARYEAVRGGYTKPASVVPLGVDLDIYRPGDRREARQKLGLPDFVLDGFVVGNVNRNQPRKRLDLTMQVFADWIHQRQISDAFLYLHVAPTGDLGYDCDQLAGYLGLQGRLILSEPAVYHGASEKGLALTYQAFDVQISTTQGEGWGLTTLEGMACGIPQVVPQWSALGEWAVPAALGVPCEPVVSMNKINTIGGTPDKGRMVDAIDALYRDQMFYQRTKKQGLLLAGQDRFRWDNIGRAFLAEVEKAIAEG